MKSLLDLYMSTVLKMKNLSYLRQFDQMTLKVLSMQTDQQLLLRFTVLLAAINRLRRYLKTLRWYHPSVRDNLSRFRVFTSAVFAGSVLSFIGNQGTIFDEIGLVNIQDFTVDLLKSTQEAELRGNLSKWKIVEEIASMEKVDDITWTQLGMLCTESAKPELSFNCYQILHLRNHGKFRTNSDLLIETTARQVNQQQQPEKATVNEVLESVS